MSISITNGTIEPLPTSPGDEWQGDALCAQSDPELFFPEKGGSPIPAKKICGSCEVATECLSFALANGERFGIWGGLTAKERNLFRRVSAPSQKTAARERRDLQVMKLRAFGRSAVSIARTMDLDERTVHRIIRRASQAQKSA